MAFQEKKGRLSPEAEKADVQNGRQQGMYGTRGGLEPNCWALNPDCHSPGSVTLDRLLSVCL